MLIKRIKRKTVAVYELRHATAPIGHDHRQSRCNGFVHNQSPLLSCAGVDERLCKRVVDRQFVVTFEAGEMHVRMQVESGELRVESFSERTVTQQHEVPRSAAREFRLL